MFGREISDMVMFAISLFLVAMTMWFASKVLFIESEVASVYNFRETLRFELQNHREYARYDSKTLYGEDVISCVTEHAFSDIPVYVNRDASGVSFFVNYSLAKSTASLTDVATLQLKFTPNLVYKAILCYDLVDPRTVTATTTFPDRGSNEVTGIAIFYQGVR